jgi:hypothetical protein
VKALTFIYSVVAVVIFCAPRNSEDLLSMDWYTTKSPSTSSEPPQTLHAIEELMVLNQPKDFHLNLSEFINMATQARTLMAMVNENPHAPSLAL